jgi:hypothetical protein
MSMIKRRFTGSVWPCKSDDDRAAVQRHVHYFVAAFLGDLTG